jgi:hypothetical protein
MKKITLVLMLFAFSGSASAADKDPCWHDNGHGWAIGRCIPQPPGCVGIPCGEVPSTPPGRGPRK